MEGSDRAFRSTHGMTVTPMWERVVGQERAVKMLQRDAQHPVHSYLLSGPPGAGAEEAARCFAAALLCPDGGCGVCSTCDRVVRSRHPDAVEIEPEGTFLVVDQVSEIAREAFASPYEADLRVILVFEAERMNEAAANKLLKTLEEPPERTRLVLVTGAPEELPRTVRSRCRQVSLNGVSEAVISRALGDAGIPSDRALLAARLSGGRLDRARAFADGALALVRGEALGAMTRLDGTGAAVSVAADELMGAVERGLGAIEAQHARESEELDQELSKADYPDRVVRRMHKDLAQRQERAIRRARVDLLVEAVTAMETYLRDSLVPGSPALNMDRPPPAPAARSVVAALDACRSARAALEQRIALNERLLLQRLLLSLAG